ncbi:sensor domain-containing diguanylate cyclase [Sinorhizobium sp. BG8]|uniref:sensor domain-containing diguanylate cyclase n=1 Tax=Sinorhizobium sp. BG8 TaxID=2613773 RepID=UPI00193EB63D|nr:sensor domain-containing diguanylate cyclase [Sinorhizobium sp. BG8]QRM54633.1 diguanylate cyclase [Sinorhizobium sp. BG8]
MAQRGGNRQTDTDDGSAGATTVAPLADLRQRSINELIAIGLEKSQVASALFSPDDRLVYASDSFKSLFDLTTEIATFADIVRHCFRSGTGPVVTAPLDDWLAMAGAKRRSAVHRSFEIDTCDGRWFLVNETVVGDGWLWSVFSDISMLKSNERTLKLAHAAAEIAAQTDPLTGLFNRRHAMTNLEATVAAHRESAMPLCLMLIDLDHFKDINDRFGHARGDAVLCHFAATARCHLRAQDLLARIGGEEFMLIMRGTRLGQAHSTAERLRAHLAESAVIDLDCRYTMSAGIAEYGGETAGQFFDRADRALYRAKNGGRDRVEEAPEIQGLL